jgi:hypothetical protein
MGSFQLLELGGMDERDSGIRGDEEGGWSMNTRWMLVSVSVVTAALLVLPAVASASVKYADYRQTSDSSIFVKHDSNGDGDWHHVTSGGYKDGDTDWPCHVTHGWSWTSGYDRDE